MCPTEITQFSDRAAEFEALGAKAAMVSIDSKFSHLAWIQTPRKAGGLGKMAIPLIADVTKAMSKAFAALIEDPADPDCGVALRATVIIDPEGIVQHLQYNNLPVGRSTDEILRLLKAFQHAGEDEKGKGGREGKTGVPMCARMLADAVYVLPVHFSLCHSLSPSPCSQVRRGVPCQLGPRQEDHDRRPQEEQGVLRGHLWR